MELKGIIPYLVSPVDQTTGRVKEETFLKLCDDLYEKGVDGYCVLGSVGEFPYLTREQKETIVRLAVQKGREHSLPVISGIMGFSVQQAIEEGRRFRELGADALVLMIETYFPLTEDEISRFIHSVSSALYDTEIILYSNSKYMHYEFSLGLFEKIQDCQNINYYKDANGNTGFLMSLTNRFGNRFKLFSASAHIPLFVFELGGKGWMAGPACIIPGPAKHLWNLYESGDHEAALSYQRKVWKVNQAFAKYDLTSCVKAVLQHQGYDVGDPILPLLPISAEATAEVCAVVDNLNREFPGSREKDAIL